MSSSKTIKHIVIIGGGISGLAAALAVHALGISCSIYEVRAVPSTLGGAVNLTPSALRCLDHIGVLKHLQGKGGTTRAVEVFSALRGVRLGELSFRNVDKIGYHALRILRAELQQGMISALGEANLKVEYGKKLVDLRETPESVEAVFEDGSVATGDILLGCDGIHSIARTKLVDPDRTPVYSGVAAAYGLLPVSSISSPIHFEDCALNSSRRGSLLAVFCDPAKQRLYIAAVMEMKEQANREGWKVKNSDQDAIRQEIFSRFGDSKMACLGEMIERVEDLFLFPVHTLPPGGKWSSERVLLLGDAAHAMPPQGESIGFALEDAVLFARVMECNPGEPISTLFGTYEGLRRSTIDTAFRDAEFRWDGLKDKGWLGRLLMDILTPVFLWWTKHAREEAWAADIRDLVPSKT